MVGNHPHISTYSSSIDKKNIKKLEEFLTDPCTSVMGPIYAEYYVEIPKCELQKKGKGSSIRQVAVKLLFFNTNQVIVV